MSESGAAKQLAEDLGGKCGALTDRVVELVEERKRLEPAAARGDVRARERLDELDDDIDAIRAEIDPAANAYYEAAIAARRFSWN
jgi:hypothetical protein